MGKLKKYSSLYLTFIKAGFQSDIEYRANYIVRILTDIFWFASNVVLFEVLYAHVDHLGGWDLHEIRIFLGVVFIVDALYMILFSNNLYSLTQSIKMGDLDLLLTKPIDSQFMVSLQKVNVIVVFNFIFSVAWFVWAVLNYEQSISMGQWVLFSVMCLCGLSVIYCCHFFFSSLALYFVAADNIVYVWYQLYKLGNRPISIYPTWLRYTLLTILPVGIISNVPSQIIFGEITSTLFIFSVAVTIILFMGVRKYWKLGLKKYSSASS